MPTADTSAEATAERANEQMYLGDAAIAPEAVPAPVTRKKIAKTKSGKTNKAGSSAKKVKPKAVAKKTKSSAGSKGVGKKKAAKKVAKSTKRRRASR
jgi:hypothetical protein